jgi:hypothetical protein
VQECTCSGLKGTAWRVRAGVLGDTGCLASLSHAARAVSKVWWGVLVLGAWALRNLPGGITDTPARALEPTSQISTLAPRPALSLEPQEDFIWFPGLALCTLTPAW